jgi:hypothetical protein
MQINYECHELAFDVEKTATQTATLPLYQCYFNPYPAVNMSHMLLTDPNCAGSGAKVMANMGYIIPLSASPPAGAAPLNRYIYSSPYGGNVFWAGFGSPGGPWTPTAYAPVLGYALSPTKPCARAQLPSDPNQAAIYQYWHLYSYDTEYHRDPAAPDVLAAGYDCRGSAFNVFGPNESLPNGSLLPLYECYARSFAGPANDMQHFLSLDSQCEGGGSLQFSPLGFVASESVPRTKLLLRYVAQAPFGAVFWEGLFNPGLPYQPSAYSPTLGYAPDGSGVAP